MQQRGGMKQNVIAGLLGYCRGWMERAEVEEEWLKELIVQLEYHQLDREKNLIRNLILIRSREGENCDAPLFKARGEATDWYVAGTIKATVLFSGSKLGYCKMLKVSTDKMMLYEVSQRKQNFLKRRQPMTESEVGTTDHVGCLVSVGAKVFCTASTRLCTRAQFA